MAGLDDPAFYGDHWASVYDESVGGPDPTGAVEFLASLAGDGRVLELAIGTGRVALPLAGRGVKIEGIDASAAIVERLRAKPGGASVPVFRNVARVVEPGGLFVIECFVPDPSRFDRGQRVHLTSVTEDSATVILSRHDAAGQRVMSQIITFHASGMRMHPIASRYSWPSELDLMASQAGLRLKERYGDWHRKPFDGGSGHHVSVYELASS